MTPTVKATLHVAVWEWKNSQGAWRTYSPEVSQLLERGHHKHLSSLLLGDADPCLTPYTVSLSLMRQIHSDTGVEKAVRRTFLPQRSPAGSGVVWQWGDEEEEVGVDPLQWHDYTMPVQCVVEDAWAQGAQTVDISEFFPEYPFIVDFCNLTQHHLENDSQRHVRRQKQASYPVARPPPGYVYPAPVPIAQNNNTLGRREQRLKQQKQQQKNLPDEPIQQKKLAQPSQPSLKQKPASNSSKSLPPNKKKLDPPKHQKNSGASSKCNDGGRQHHCFSLRQVLPDDTSAGDEDDSYYPSSTDASRLKSSARGNVDELRQPLMPGVSSSSSASASLNCGGVVVVAKQQQQYQNKTALTSNGAVNTNKPKKGHVSKHKSSATSNEKYGVGDSGQSASSALLSKVLSFGLHHSGGNSNSNHINNNFYNSSPSSRSSSSSSCRLAEERQHSSATPSPPPLPLRSVVGVPSTLSSLPPLHCSTPLPDVSTAPTASSDCQTKVKNLINIKMGYNYYQHHNHQNTTRSNDSFSVRENSINQRKLDQTMGRGTGLRQQNQNSSAEVRGLSYARGRHRNGAVAADHSDRSSCANVSDRLSEGYNDGHIQHSSGYVNLPGYSGYHNHSYSRARSLDPATNGSRSLRRAGNYGSNSNPRGKLDLPAAYHSLSRPGSPRTDAWTTPTATPACERRRMGASSGDGESGVPVSSPPTPLPRTVVPPTPLPRTVLPAALLPHRSPPYMRVPGPEMSPCQTLASYDGVSLASGRRSSLETISTYLSTDDVPQQHSFSEASVAHLVDFSLEDSSGMGYSNASPLSSTAAPTNGQRVLSNMATSINSQLSSSSNSYQSCPNYFQSTASMRNSDFISYMHASPSSVQQANNHSSLSNPRSNHNMHNEIANSSINSINAAGRNHNASNCNNNNRILPSSTSSIYVSSSGTNTPSTSISSNHPFLNQSNYLLPISSCRPEQGNHPSQNLCDDESDDDGEVFTSADQEVRRVMSATIARTARHTANKKSTSASIDLSNSYSSAGSVREAMC